MPAPDIDSTLSDIERQMAELARLKEAYALVQAHQTQMAAAGGKTIATVIQKAQDEPARTVNTSPDLEPSLASIIGTMSKSDMVRLAIDAAGGDFTAGNLHEWLEGAGYEIGRQDVSFVLSRLAKSGEVRLRAAGKGARPNVFRNPSGHGVVTPPTVSKPAHGRTGMRQGAEMGNSGTMRALAEWLTENPGTSLWEITKGTGLPIEGVEKALSASPDFFRSNDGGRTWKLA